MEIKASDRGGLKMIETIIEGCMPDTPGRLMYAGIDTQIPENAKILFWDHDYHPMRYLLYAQADEDFMDFEVLDDYGFLESEIGFLESNRFFRGGFPLRKYEPNFSWIFDAQRSLTTRDGRIYVEAGYFTKDWRWYLNAVSRILSECGEIFRGEKDEMYFINKPSSSR